MTVLTGVGALALLSAGSTSSATPTSDLPAITASWSVTLDDAGYP